MAAESTLYRNLQNSFVSNLNGTTAFEISFVTSSIPVSVLVRSLLWSFLARNCQTLKGIFPTSVIFILEYVTLVLPTFLVFTVLADYAYIFNLLLLLLATMGLFFQGNSVQNQTFPIVDKKQRFLCNFRAYVNIATAISILAVDFTIYPRRYAKTETYGTALMDVGVGSFIIANAVVCQEARGVSTMSFMKALKKELRAVFMLLGLGLLRFAAVKTTEYQEHVSEYGVHWNFFLTLACVRILSVIILRTLPEYLGKHPWIIGVFIGLFYQHALVNGLEKFILHGSKGDGSRSNFIDANREGICSSLGYVALYFIGVSLGKLIFYNKSNSLRSLLKLFILLMCIAGLCWSTLWYWGTMHTLSPERIISRRLANFPFLLWQVGYNVLHLAFLLAVDILMVALSSTQTLLRYPGGCVSCSSTVDTSYKHDSVQELSPNLLQDSSHTLRSRKLENKTFLQTTYTKQPQEKTSAVGCSCLISAVNYNLLAYFLIANLFTGFVNLVIETVNTSPVLAFVIMNVYLLLLHAVITVFYNRKILLKF